MYEGEPIRPSFSSRVGGVLDRTEAIYLRVLRAVILLIASGLVLYAGWLGISGIYNSSKSTSSVVEATASVAADDLTAAGLPLPKAGGRGAEPQDNPAHRKFYADFVKGYHTLFQTKFEPFRQPDDKQLTRDEFDDSFLDSAGRLEQIRSGELNFTQDQSDLQAMMTVITEAADKPATATRLNTYKNAKKQRVESRVQRTRTTYRNGWNSYSTACSNWFYSPIGCPERRAVRTPYTETVVSMQFPEGTQSHSDIFRAYQERYFSLLQERRLTNSREAEQARIAILASNAKGDLSLRSALYIFAAFLVLMFFFLLIAIERHQRRLSTGPVPLLSDEPMPETVV
jgi:hypothetical protein